jgi:hypothetical protein
VVGILDPCLSFFFVFFCFFFFLSTELLALEISLSEEDGMEEDLASGEVKKILLVKKVKDQHEADVLGGEVLTTEALTAFGIT